jgi:hypothetical protein
LITAADNLLIQFGDDFGFDGNVWKWQKNLMILMMHLILLEI